jgi:thioredoxin-like negative regulator of GroEL
MPAITLLDQFEYHHRLAATPGPALVFFTAPACGACKRLRQVFTQETWPGMTLFEVDAARDLALTREFDLFHLPAMFLYVDGRFHREIHAEASPEPLRRALAEALRAPPGDAP